MQISRRLALAAGCLLPFRALAATWPTKPVHLILPIAPGTATDVNARILADQLSTRLGRRFLVDNRPGANGAIAAEYVATAPGDGYTLLFAAASALTITPHLLDNLHWNALTDFTPIVELGTTPDVIAVGKASPIVTLDDLVRRAQAKPDGIKAGIVPLTLSEFVMRLLESAAKINFRAVSYNSGAEMLNAAMSNEVDVIFFGIGGAAAQVAPDGTLRALATTTAKRLESLPDVMTVSEKYPGFDAGSWFALFGPKQLAPDVAVSLNAAVNATIAEPGIKAKLEALGTIPTGGSAEDLRARLEADYKRYGELIHSVAGKAN